MNRRLIVVVVGVLMCLASGECTFLADAVDAWSGGSGSGDSSDVRHGWEGNPIPDPSAPRRSPLSEDSSQ